jgi:thiol-disulfide isomerase/thioredoxin
MKTLLVLCWAAGIVLAQPVLAPLDQSTYPKVLAGHRGKVVLANFWATWCEPCRKEMPELVKLSRTLSARGFDLVLISADEPEQETAARKVLGGLGAASPLYILKTADNDKFYPTVDSKWASGALPALFLYDRSGKKVRAFIGETSMKDLEAAIAKLL